MNDDLNTAKAYEFGEFRLEPDNGKLWRGDETIAVTHKAIELLKLLVDKRGMTVSKNEILDTLWHDTYVDENNLAVTVSALRRALGEGPHDNRFIETVPKRGYRFVAEAVETNPSYIIERRTQTRITVAEDDGHILGRIRGWSLQTKALVVVVAFLAVVGSVIAFRSLTAPPSDVGGGALAPNAPVRAVAVLPFSHIGGGDRNEMLNFGITDTLITRLSKIREVAVRPTSSVWRYAGEKPDVVVVGRELKVDAVLQGSVQRIGDSVRINVQLVNTSDGLPIWAESFDSNLADIFALQDSIAQRTARALTVELTNEEWTLMARRPTENSEAFRLYLIGRYYWNKRTPESLKQSIATYQEALSKDADFALAYAGLADCYQLLAEYLVSTPNEAFPMAKEAALKALAIDGRLAEAHTSLGYALAFYDWDWPAAEREFKLAIELDPNYATAHQWYAEVLTALGRFDEATTEMQRARYLDPTSQIIRVDLSAVYFAARRFDLSLAEANEVIAAEPNFAYAHLIVWFNLEQMQRRDEAAAAYVRAIQLFGETSAATELSQALTKNGVTAMWEERLRQVEQSSAFSSMWRAVVQIQLGNDDKAIEWLEKSFEERDRWIANLKTSPAVDRLRSNPRFQALEQRVGF
ncbi:MAG: winged helix-turn-helix domain-containing protein [Pyrinomonadaceae bacterium]